MLKDNYFARKKRRNIKRIKTSIIKMEYFKISKLLNQNLWQTLDQSKWFIKWSVFW